MSDIIGSSFWTDVDRKETDVPPRSHAKAMLDSRGYGTKHRVLRPSRTNLHFRGLKVLVVTTTPKLFAISFLKSLPASVLPIQNSPLKPQYLQVSASPTEKEASSDRGGGKTR
jgi:hypothetical protein